MVYDYIRDIMQFDDIWYKSSVLMRKIFSNVSLMLEFIFRNQNTYLEFVWFNFSSE